jgi:hypothetical protein
MVFPPRSSKKSRNVHAFIIIQEILKNKNFLLDITSGNPENTDIKAEGQQNPVFKPELLALAFHFGGLAEWLNAADCKSATGAQNIGQGFKSLTRRHFSLPVMALTTTRERNAQPKPHESANSDYGFWL